MTTKTSTRKLPLHPFRTEDPAPMRPLHRPSDHRRPSSSVSVPLSVPPLPNPALIGAEAGDVLAVGPQPATPAGRTTTTSRGWRRARREDTSSSPSALPLRLRPLRLFPFFGVGVRLGGGAVILVLDLLRRPPAAAIDRPPSPTPPPPPPWRLPSPYRPPFHSSASPPSSPHESIQHALNRPIAVVRGCRSGDGDGDGGCLLPRRVR